MAEILPDVRVLAGATEGPSLGLLGGVHGDELEGVISVRRVIAFLSTMRFSGRVVWAAPAHPAAWAAFQRVSPDDGLNLARVFPGNSSGRPTERVAACLTTELIRQCDLLIDLHSAGTTFDMPLLAGFHSAGNLAPRAEAASAAFGAPFIWQHPDTAGGRSLSAAEDLGIPSIYVESRGGGHLRKQDIDAYFFGVLRVMTHLRMLDAAAINIPRKPACRVVRGDGNTDEGIVSRSTGYFIASCDVGDAVDGGSRVGSIVDTDGHELEEVVTATGGAVMLLRRLARVDVGDTLAITAEVVGGDAT